MPDPVNNHCGFAAEADPITPERQEFRDFLLAGMPDSILSDWEGEARRIALADNSDIWSIKNGDRDRLIYKLFCESVTVPTLAKVFGLSKRRVYEVIQTQTPIRCGAATPAEINVNDISTLHHEYQHSDGVIQNVGQTVRKSGKAENE